MNEKLHDKQFSQYIGKTTSAFRNGFFAIALIAMAIIPVYAQQYNPESDFQIDWATNNKDSVIITGYIGTRKEVSIPPKIQNNPVTGIGYEAFREDRDITKVTIPDSVTSIGYMAFRYCTSLTSVTIPDSVTSIGYMAFRYCTSLTSITIPSGVTSIGNNAFAYCIKLTSVTIPDSVTSIGGCAFENCTILTSVTFQGKITANKFDEPFDGDLRAKYLASDGGPGTYKRFAGGEVWKKQ